MKLDAAAALAFLLESGTNPMSGVGLEIYRIPTGYKGDFVEDLYHALLGTDVVEPFDRAIALNSSRPLQSHWQEPVEIDMTRHIKRHVLPKPGGTRELMDVVQMLAEHPLDRSLPLWECHLISGLKGRRFALCFKCHHAILDGTSGMARLAGSKTTNPKDKTVRGIWSRIPGIHDQEHIKRKAPPRNLGKLARDLYEQSIRTTRQYVDMLDYIVNEVGLSKFIRDSYTPHAPGHLPFNAKGDFGKSVAAVTLSLEKMKTVAKAQSSTLNDVFLATVSGGLYGYLKARDEVPDSNLVAQIPVNLREPGDLEAGNKITMMFVNLGDPDDTNRGRLSSITADTRSKKKIARVADKRALIAYSLVTAGLGAITSLFPDSNQAANVVVSNVPGSKKKLYLMGAEMEASYAFNVLPPGISLIIVGFSYCDSMDIGIVAHRSAIADLDVLAGKMESTFRGIVRSCTRKSG